MPAAGQYSEDEPTASRHNLARNLDKAPKKVFEFHPQNVLAYCRRQGNHAVPGLQTERSCRFRRSAQAYFQVLL